MFLLILFVYICIGSTPGSPAKNPKGSPGLDPDNPFYDAGEDPSKHPSQHPSRTNPPESNGLQVYLYYLYYLYYL